jgi:thioredoxin 1
MLPLIVTVLFGAGVGAAFGYWSRCGFGACPLVATWKRGALFGAALAALVYFVSGQFGSASMNESTANVKRIGPDQFQSEVERAAKPVMVDFYATWCGPCRMLAPRVDELAGRLGGRIKFVKVNVDEAPALAQRFQIEGIPTLLFFKNGRLVDRLVGLPSTDALQTRLESLADSGPDHKAEPPADPQG